MRGERGLRLALRLHPARHRREWGPEMAAVFADSTAGAGRWEVAREVFDLAGHGLRARTGLGSAGRPAELAALAAPFAVAALGGFGLYELLGSVVLPLLHGYPPNLRLLTPGPDRRLEPGLSAVLTASRSAPLLFVAALVAAAFGRWSVARLLAPLGAVLLVTGEFVLQLGWHPHPACCADLRRLAGSVLVMSPQILWGLLVPAAPRDLLSAPLRHGGRRAWATGVVFALGAAVGGPVLCAWLWYNPVQPVWSRATAGLLAQACAACALALLAVAPLALRRDRPALAAAALALLPFAGLELLLLVLGEAGGAAPILLAAVALGVPTFVVALRRPAARRGDPRVR